MYLMFEYIPSVCNTEGKTKMSTHCKVSENFHF